jgi:F-type H+-transporting ATPase subunit b
MMMVAFSALNRFSAAHGASEYAGLSHAGSSHSGFGNSGSALEIDLDLSFTLQMLLFAGLIVILKPLLFEPLLKLFTAREQRTEGARAEARAMQERAGELLRRYESELARVSQAAAAERDKARAETAKLENEMLSTARNSSARIVDQGRQEIQLQVDKSRFELGREAERLAREIATRALGREVH